MAVACSKHAFDLWVDGDERVLRGSGGGGAARVVLPQQNLDEMSASGGERSEQGSVAAHDHENYDNDVEQGDLVDDVMDAVVVDGAAAPPAGAPQNAADVPVNIVMPNIVNVERRQGQRVLETRA